MCSSTAAAGAARAVPHVAAASLLGPARRLRAAQAAPYAHASAASVGAWPPKTALPPPSAAAAARPSRRAFAPSAGAARRGQRGFDLGRSPPNSQARAAEVLQGERRLPEEGRRHLCLPRGHALAQRAAHALQGRRLLVRAPVISILAGSPLSPARTSRVGRRAMRLGPHPPAPKTLQDGDEGGSAHRPHLGRRHLRNLPARGGAADPAQRRESARAHPPAGAARAG